MLLVGKRAKQHQHTAAIDARPRTCQRRHDMAAENSPEGAAANVEAGGVNPCRQKNQYQHTAAIDPKPPTGQRRDDMAAKNSPEGATAIAEAGGVNPCRQKKPQP